MHVLRFDEIVSGALPDEDELRMREKGWVYFRGVLSTPDDVVEFARGFDIELLDPADEEQTADIVGQCASGGIVQGRVKVIFESSQMDKVQAGDILVAPMTTPDFMPVIRLAGALVTDEGGVTCHAAIVARELKKPCVIGTKTATKLLKDGDLVEVDADHGIIRNINS